MFYNCTSLENLTVSSGNTTYKSLDGNLYNYDGTELIQYAAGKTDTSFTVPDGVTSIGDYAFYYCISLESLTISDSVTSIGYYAFQNCSLLTNVTFANTIGWYVTTTEGATIGTDIDVTDKNINAENLVGTYYTYYWYRNKN